MSLSLAAQSHPVRWGFLGAGQIARMALAPAMHAAESAQLYAVAAREPSRAQALGPVGPIYDEYAAVLADPLVEAVYICLANDAHHPWALAALKAGKHVLCEKPLTMTQAHTAELYAVAESAGLLLVEATWYRWHPRTQRALELLPEIGPVHTVQADFCFGNVPAGDFRLDPTKGGGALADVGCYAVSAATIFLAATEFNVVHAELTIGRTGVDLAATAELVGGTGRALIRCGIDELEHQGVVIHGEAGRIELIAPPFTSWHDPAQLRVESPAGTRVESFPPVDAYQLMVQAVSDRIRGRPAWVLPAAESQVVAQGLAHIRAHNTGGR